MYDLPDYRLEPPEPTHAEEEFNECIGDIEWCIDQIKDMLAYADYDDIKEIKELLKQAMDAADDARDYRERW